MAANQEQQIDAGENLQLGLADAVGRDGKLRFGKDVLLGSSDVNRLIRQPLSRNLTLRAIFQSFFCSFALLVAYCNQLVCDVVLVDVRDVRDGLHADPCGGD
jgi:hypothetical protein